MPPRRPKESSPFTICTNERAASWVVPIWTTMWSRTRTWTYYGNRGATMFLYEDSSEWERERRWICGLMIQMFVLKTLHLVVTNTNDEAGGNFSEIDQHPSFYKFIKLLTSSGYSWRPGIPIYVWCMLSNSIERSRFVLCMAPQVSLFSLMSYDLSTLLRDSWLHIPAFDLTWYHGWLADREVRPSKHYRIYLHVQ